MATISNVTWVEADVISTENESRGVTSYVLLPTHLMPHLPGQHFELRLTGEDGYRAARLYSAASDHGLENGQLRLTIQNVPDGEVSSYVNSSLKAGDKVEVRGPFGRFFTWKPSDPRPVLLIGGGSGVIPLVAMLTKHAETQSSIPMKLLYSTRTFDDVLYKQRLLKNGMVTITLTAPQQNDWAGETGRISLPLLQRLLDEYDEPPLCYVCGMSPFVSAVNEGLQALGVPLSSIKTERFG